jgi:NADPH-dependent 2,4-dienoyl-CoA reductase/sulfur reductase-like enzyme
MKDAAYDAAVIGAGAAGMAAALELDKAGFSCALFERENHLGGILMQCIHTGFGLHEFNEELTGPEFAGRFIKHISGSRVAVYLNTTVLEFRSEGGVQHLVCVSPAHGVMRVRARAAVLAMGCRERSRGSAHIPGCRPAGVYTAGLAQRLVNIEGYIPGKAAVIIGSGDIGLIMARRMSWSGCTVRAVVEIMPSPAGLARNIVQCLNDFDIPLYLSTQTTKIYGADRVEGVELTPLYNGRLLPEKRFRIDCDTVLLSVGLAPENELSRAAGVELDAASGGALVDSFLMTSLDGVFACGNALHVHDLVDWVAEEARRAGRFAAQWLNGARPSAQIPVRPGPNTRYTVPGKVDLRAENRLYLRSLTAKTDALLELRIGGRVVKTVRKTRVQPSEMISLVLGPSDFAGIAPDAAAVLECAVL